MTNITVSLDTAKKLKNAGWEKRTYFIWHNGSDTRDNPKSEDNYYVVPYMGLGGLWSPTAQELLDELPKVLDIENENQSFYGKIKFEYIVDEGKFICYYIDIQRYRKDHCSENLTEALGSLRLRCKKNGYLPSA